jgi:hypothetical protein
MPGPARRFVAAFTEDLVALELPAGDESLQQRTRDWVLARIEGAGDVNRRGIALVALVLAAGVRVATGRAYTSLAPQRRQAIAARLAATGLPLAGEFTRAVRALAVTYFYDARHATAP